MIKNTRVHIIISFVIIIVAIISAWILRTAALVVEEGLDQRKFYKFYDPSVTSSNTVTTYNTLKDTNKNIVDKISQIYTQCTNKNFPLMKTTCTNLIQSLTDAKTACEDLSLNYVLQDPNNMSQTPTPSYFAGMKLAVSSILVKANDIKTYLTNTNPRVGNTTAANKFNDNNFITGFRDGGLIYEEMCKEIYTFLESDSTITRIFHKSQKKMQRPWAGWNYNVDSGWYYSENSGLHYEDEKELVLKSPFQFYCRRR